MIGDAGFRLSVAATAGLLAWATPLGRWIGGLGGGRVPGWLAEGLGHLAGGAGGDAAGRARDVRAALAGRAGGEPRGRARWCRRRWGRASWRWPAARWRCSGLPPVPSATLARAAGAGCCCTSSSRSCGSPPALPFAAVAIPPEVGAAGGASWRAVAGRWRTPLDPCAGSRARRRPRRPARAPAPAGGAARPATRRARPARPSPRRRHARAGRRARPLVVAISTLALGDAAGRATRLVMLDVGQGDAILVESRGGGADARGRRAGPGPAARWSSTPASRPGIAGSTSSC